ncbi:hypothetical protein [Photobacterium damselae]|uniref:hypothetical protein n=1 Tax=Photobacterium damselae TaxID=38293 RepID=UPI001F313877|nr:hypothetical protein [Photobacterium damselae]UKA12871.1 hypothetical protein IHC91_20995 [Photobacterium damselae subsp. damselae]
MSDKYRKEKIMIPALYLDKDEAEIILTAINKAAEKTGVTNNRKNRTSLIEIAQHYLETSK